MASAGLAQIDENSSLTQSNGNDTLVLPLPTLLSSSASTTDAPGEKTPELATRRFTFGESTPEAWPKTPTPHGRSGFALGDQTPDPWCDQTPLAWPEYAPSFHMEMQQAINFQAATLNAPSPAINTLPVLAPVWGNQIACPLGMIWDAPAFNASNSLPTGHASIPVQSSTSSATVVPVSGGPMQLVPPPNAHTLGLTTENAVVRKAATLAKKPARGGGHDANAEDECPVAVYVDLSGLKERGCPTQRGAMPQH